MAVTDFQALDNAIEAGGTKLSGKVIAGTGNQASAILAKLCSSGFLEKTGGKTAKYTIKPEGRVAWEREASAERRQQVRERDQQQQRKSLAEFLGLVEQKPEKPLTKTEIARYPDSLRQDACNRQLVEPGPRANSYRLLPAGQEQIWAELPIEQQLERLRQQWRAAQQRLRQELEGLDGQSVQAAAAELASRGQQACQAFDRALTELGAFPVLLAAAQQMRENVEAARKEALQRLESERARLAELEARLRQGAEQQREQLEAFERRIGGRLEDLGPETETFVRQWVGQRRAGCPLHELYRHLKGRSPALTIGGFHDLLRSLWDRRRIRLTGWPDSPDRMPDPNLALFISSKVMYYADTPDASV